jgi:uncharacterized DUF497 family protein
LSDLRFTWDEKKAADNIRKHGVTFGEAKTIFDDANLLVELDLEHSDVEERLHNIGFSEKARILMVVTTDRNETIRIISARRATKAEARRYAEQVHG